MLAFWKGNGVNIIRIFPYSAAQLASNDSYKRLLADDKGELTVARRLLSGACAGMTATALTHPLDTVRLRLALPNHTYKGGPAAPGRRTCLHPPAPWQPRQRGRMRQFSLTPGDSWTDGRMAGSHSPKAPPPPPGCWSLQVPWTLQPPWRAPRAWSVCTRESYPP